MLDSRARDDAQEIFLLRMYPASEGATVWSTYIRVPPSTNYEANRNPTQIHESPPISTASSLDLGRIDGHGGSPACGRGQRSAGLWSWASCRSQISPAAVAGRSLSGLVSGCSSSPQFSLMSSCTAASCRRSCMHFFMRPLPTVLPNAAWNRYPRCETTNILVISPDLRRPLKQRLSTMTLRARPFDGDKRGARQ